MFNENTWKEGEKLAADYMKKHGYRIVYTNFSCVGIELDIVAILSKKVQAKKVKIEYKFNLKNAKTKQEKQMIKLRLDAEIRTLQDLLVVTEVKARATDKFGIGAEAVSSFKKQNIKRGARLLSSQDKFKGLQVRFDVASVDGGVVSYIENAF